MKYPNAYSGVKKLFTAEILGLIGTIALVIATFAALVTVGAVEAEEEAVGVASLGVAAVFGLVGGVLAIIAFIIEIVGLSSRPFPANRKKIGVELASFREARISRGSPPATSIWSGMGRKTQMIQGMDGAWN